MTKQDEKEPAEDRVVHTYSDEFTCSFCGKPRREVRDLISGGGGKGRVAICNECTDLCADLCEEHKREAAAKTLLEVEPSELEQHMAGQLVRKLRDFGLSLYAVDILTTLHSGLPLIREMQVIGPGGRKLSATLHLNLEWQADEKT